MRFPTGFVFEPYAHYRMAPLTSIQYGQLAEVSFIMNWDQASGKWNQIKGSVRKNGASSQTMTCRSLRVTGIA